MNFAIMAGNRATVAPEEVATLEHRKLTDAAQQFEGILLQELLKPMRDHGFSPDGGRTGDGDQGESGGDIFSGFGTEVMATAIAKAGGLGIAKRVVAQVENERASYQKGTDSGRKELPNSTVRVTAALKSANGLPMNKWRTEVSA